MRLEAQTRPASLKISPRKARNEPKELCKGPGSFQKTFRELLESTILATVKPNTTTHRAF